MVRRSSPAAGYRPPSSIRPAWIRPAVIGGRLREVRIPGFLTTSTTPPAGYAAEGSMEAAVAWRAAEEALARDNAPTEPPPIRRRLTLGRC
jgi:hypothetical protein